MSSHNISNLFIYGSFSFLLGILLYGFGVQGIFVYISALGIGFLIAFIYKLQNNGNQTIILFFITFCFLFGALRFYSSSIKDVSFVKKDGVFLGTIVNNPKKTTYGQSFIVKNSENGFVFLRNNSPEKFTYGDTISFLINCSVPKNFTTTIGTEFDYKNYLKKDHILSLCQASSVTLKERLHFSIRRTLYDFSNAINRQLERIFVEPYAGIISGILMGNRSSISQDILTDFTKTGTIHLLALSGYNIAIVTYFFQKIFEFLFKRKIALTLSALSVVSFVLMTGASASAVRAGIMVMILILGKLFYREYQSLRALYIALVIMVFLNPYTLLFDVSFHLSFLATFGLIVLEPLLRKTFSFLLYKPLILFFSTSFAAQIMTLPYVLYVFQSLSLSSFIANIVVAPLIPILMFLGFISLFLSIPSQIFSTPLVFVTEYIVKVVLKIIHLFSTITNGFFVFEYVPLFAPIFLYILIFWLLYEKHKIIAQQEKI